MLNGRSYHQWCYYWYYYYYNQPWASWGHHGWCWRSLLRSCWLSAGQCSVAGALSVSVTYVDMIVLETRKPQKPLCHNKDGWWGQRVANSFSSERRILQIKSKLTTTCFRMSRHISDNSNCNNSLQVNNDSLATVNTNNITLKDNLFIWNNSISLDASYYFSFTVKGKSCS